MIAYRGAQRLTICDDCGRPQQPGETGWTQGKLRLPYRSPDQVMRGEASSEALEVDADFCGSCAAGRVDLVPSDCGHAQAKPTDEEIVGCPEVIVRACATCGVELWWNVDRWKRP